MYSSDNRRPKFGKSTIELYRASRSRRCANIATLAAFPDNLRDILEHGTYIVFLLLVIPVAQARLPLEDLQLLRGRVASKRLILERAARDAHI